MDQPAEQTQNDLALHEMVNIQPFLDIGMKPEETEPVLYGIFALLQIHINEEISKTLTEEDEKLVKETFDADDHMKIAIAYDELYKEKKGKSLEEFSKNKLSELIDQTAKFLSEQKEFITKASQFNEEDSNKFIEFVNQEKYEEAEAMLRS